MVSSEYLKLENFLCASQLLTENNKRYAFEGQDLIKCILVNVSPKTFLSAPGICFLTASYYEFDIPALTHAKVLVVLFALAFATVNTVRKQTNKQITSWYYYENVIDLPDLLKGS